MHCEITPNTQYALVLEAESEPSSSNYYYIRGGMSVGSPYSGGKMYKFGLGGTWIAYETQDFYFKIFTGDLGVDSIHRGWLEYQANNNMLIARDYKTALNDVANLYIFSGYQNRLHHGETILERYGMDWSVISDTIDYAISGYGYDGVTQYMDATQSALGITPLIGGVINSGGFFQETYDYCMGGVMYAYWDNPDAGYSLELYKKASENDKSLPTEYALEQNFPNPFNPATTIKFDLPKAGNVELVVYDVLGRRVRTLLNENKEPGRYEVNWDASDVVSGIYIYQLVSNSFITSRKMLLIK